MLGRVATAAVRYGFLGLVGMACLGPVAWVLMSSFKTQTQIFGSGSLLPRPFTGLPKLVGIFGPVVV